MKFKKIAAVVSAAAVMLALAGCGKEEKKPEPGANITESRLESLLEDDPNLNPPAESKGTEGSQPENSVPEVKPIEMSDEIKNAALNSGLVQYNNDIFQRGGYITVADFVEQWKDKYDITYLDGTYEERKEYLIKYSDIYFNSYPNSAYYRWPQRSRMENSFSIDRLTLTPKNNTGGPVTAFIANVTSPDEKITIDKAIVMELDYHSTYEERNNGRTPEWIPMGFADHELYFKVNFESENKNYTVNTLCEALEAKGIKEKEEGSKSYINTYYKSTLGFDDIYCEVLGEENLFGAKPLYRYSFMIDPNTDKVKYAGCRLLYFVKE